MVCLASFHVCPTHIDRDKVVGAFSLSGVMQLDLNGLKVVTNVRPAGESRGLNLVLGMLGLATDVPVHCGLPHDRHFLGSFCSH